MRIDFRSLVLMVVAAVVLGAGGAEGQREAGGGAAAGGSRPPNIVLILADDLGHGDTGIYGSRIVQTPRIDALAGDGVRFVQGYVSHPVCSPSRAGLMTGRYQTRHGWEFNPVGGDAKAGMSTAERTLADELRAQGYATGMVGKWHLGRQRQHHPMSRGFDEYFGILEGGSTFIDSRVEGVEFAALSDEPAPTERPNRVLRGFDEVKVDGYLTDVFTDEAVDFIDRHRDRPFFLYLSHITPHTPLQATARYLDRYRHIEDRRTRVYSAMVAALDDSVGRVVETLKRVGQYDDTLFVFASDNGCADYVRGACTNAPLHGFKSYHHEGGVRIPFIVSWPARLPAGKLFQEPVSTLDLMATFTAAAGKGVTTEDSVDLLPFLEGRRSGSPHDYLYWKAGPTVAIRDDRYKLIRYNRTEHREEELTETGRLPPPAEGWSTASSLGQLTLLYDLTVDPGESTNLAQKHPEVVARLEQKLGVWLHGMVDPILPPVRSSAKQIDGEWVQMFF